MRIGVPKEVSPGERRVALVPEAVRRLSGFDVVVASLHFGLDRPPEGRYIALAS